MGFIKARRAALGKIMNIDHSALNPTDQDPSSLALCSVMAWQDGFKQISGSQTRTMPMGLHSRNLTIVASDDQMLTFHQDL